MKFMGSIWVPGDRRYDGPPPKLPPWWYWVVMLPLALLVGYVFGWVF